MVAYSWLRASKRYSPRTVTGAVSCLRRTYFSGPCWTQQPQGQISRCNWTRVVYCSESKLGVAGLVLWAQLGLSWRQRRTTNKNTHRHARTNTRRCRSLSVNKLAPDAKKSPYRWWISPRCSSAADRTKVLLYSVWCFFLSMNWG